MPYRLDPERPRCVQVKRSGGWQRLKCHGSARKARRHLAALRINVSEQLSGDEARIRRELLRASVNGRLLDAILRHRHYLQRVENGTLRRILEPIRDALRELRVRLIRRTASLGASTDMSRLLPDQVRELERTLSGLLAATEITVTSSVRAELERIAEMEYGIQGRLLRRQVPDMVGLQLGPPDIQRVAALVNSPLGGQLYHERLRQNYGESLLAIRRSLATSVALGEGVDAGARRLTRKVADLTLNRATTLFRSEVQRVANTVAMDNYRQNADVIKAVQVVETLDDRTCLICAGRDGDVHPLDVESSELPPYHAACRGFVSPVTRSFAELGIPLTDVSPGSRASMNGQVPGPITYPEWFSQQSPAFQRRVLGPERYRRWKAGLVDIEGMAKDGRILSLDELPELSLAS